jgi:formate hydrogenlyase transcriptional activator
VTSVLVHPVNAASVGLFVGDSRQLLQLVADALPNGVLVIGPEGIITLVNQEFERQFGYAREDLVGESPNVVLPDVLDALEAQLGPKSASSRTATRPFRSDAQLVGRRRDGSTIRVEVGFVPVSNEQSSFVLATVVRVTTQGQTEKAVSNRVDFECLVADLSDQLKSLPAAQAPGILSDALRRIGEALEVDRCTFFQLETDSTIVDPLSWQQAGSAPSLDGLSVMDRFPGVWEAAREGRVVTFSHPAEVPNPVDRANFEAFGTRSAVILPIFVSAQLAGAISLETVRGERAWSPEVVHRLRLVGSVLGNLLARRQSDRAIARADADLKRLRNQLHDENLHLRREVTEFGTGGIVGKSAAIREILEQVQQVAATDSTVLVLGETGTGKELFATRIHELSTRRGAAMVRVNCAAIPSALIESELFGREKGAFTGALSRQAGRFELANRSSIFLDEIGDLPLEVQVKLLRVLEERQVERLGSPKPIQVDTRIIAATHRDLEQRMAEGTFREDLFYRMNVFPIRVPPLRDRIEDIPLLVWRFVTEFSQAFGKRIDVISRENMAALQRYTWPGNIRELRNVVERAMIVATGPGLTITPPMSSVAAAKHSTKLIDVETDHIRSVLDSTAWRIRGVGGAADRLGLKPTTLETRMAKLGLSRPKPA